ncbi:MAG: diacylglycerol/lipid kinase family protein [Phenylobacterium sp.]|uniref:diacylglycerol/lipid kinase family protein n=1 Tax=Phenylobacterium sp. TaxID=1871053 RepID=UPI00391B9E9E
MVNLASGSVDRDAPQTLEALLAEHGLDARVEAPEPGHLARTLQSAIDAAPDLLIVLAGDGTARAAAEAAGPDGPLIAPLPGGTMNMLPRAVYGRVSWPDALRSALEGGREQSIGGGEIEGKSFLVAAILGSPALWAPAREAVREGRFSMALRRARRAWRQTFSGRLRYSLEQGPRGKAEAVAFLCPLASRALPDDEQALEAAVFDVRGAADAFRMGVHAMIDDWRNAPAVETRPSRTARAWAAGRIPAVLDGEPTRLPSMVSVSWRPKVARVLAPRQEHGI